MGLFKSSKLAVYIVNSVSKAVPVSGVILIFPIEGGVLIFRMKS